MSYRTVCIWLAVIALLVIAYGNALSIPVQDFEIVEVVEAQRNKADPIPTPDPKLINLLISPGQGVMLSRYGWTQFTRVGFGTMLHERDLLRAEDQATVLCADLTLKTITGEQRCPCQTMTQGVLVYEDALVASSTRHLRSAPTEIPYIIHPRNTWIAGPHPLLRWNPTGVTSYTVSIMAEGDALWSQSDIISNSIHYPDDAPALQAGMDYLLVVEDQYSGNVSTADPEKGLGFRLLSEEERSKIAALQDEISKLASLNEPARNLVLAFYLANIHEGERGLWSEAALLLEQASAVQDAPAVRLYYGDVLAAMKLPDEARVAYETALKSAERLKDMETEAAAHAALWQLISRPNSDTHFEQAVKLYEALGEQERLESLQEEVRK